MKYNTTVYFEGTIDYEVEAPNETEAKIKAMDMFREESGEVVMTGVAEANVCECIEDEDAEAEDDDCTTAIAIDGPAAAGKSTLSRALAKKLGYIYVDTGALYRAVALSLLRGDVDFSDNIAVDTYLKEQSVTIALQNREQRVLLNGEDVSDKIRTPEISMRASDCSALPEVRAFLLELQRSIAQTHNVVMDGRDIGTVVLPDAKTKIFLTASPQTRALRRYKELCEKGEKVTFKEVFDDMAQRDYNDSHREIAPLAAAPGAITVDTTGYTIEHVLDVLLEIVAITKL